MTAPRIVVTRRVPEPALELLHVPVPHLGSATIQTRTAMAVPAARNVVAALSGEAPPSP